MKQEQKDKMEELAKMYSSVQDGNTQQIEDAYKSGFSKALKLYGVSNSTVNNR